MEGFFFDRFCSQKVATLFRETLEQPVHHLEDDHQPNTPDSLWLPWAAERDLVVLTADEMIHRHKEQLKVIRSTRSIIFVFQFGNVNTWDRFQVLVKSFQHIRKGVELYPVRPSVYIVPKNGLGSDQIARFRRKNI
jgi:hypothetical protein